MKRSKFQDQLRRSFIGYVSIIILAILLLYLGGFALNFATVVIRDNRTHNRGMAQGLADQCMAYEEGIQTLAALPQIRTALSDPGLSSRSAMNRILYDFANRQQLRPYFVLLDLDQKVVCSNLREGNQLSFASSPFAGQVISRLEGAPEQMLCFVCTAPLTSDQACCYSFCRTVPGPDGQSMGYLFLNLRQDDLHAMARQLPQQVLLTDTYHNIIYTTLEAEEDPMDKLPAGKYAIDVEDSGVRRLDGSCYYVYAQTLPRQNLRLYTLTPLDTHIRTLWSALTLFGVLLAVLSALVVALTRAFAQRNARELGELTHAVEQLDQENMAHELSPQASEEAQQLYIQFRALVLHNRALLERRRLMEVKQLEEQFNPHFVFNVMETVRYQIEEDPEAASEMLLSFASLMRYSIDHNQAKVTLETDVQYVNDYLLLQKIRYNNCLCYELLIPDELLDCQIPKLMLQPIIENSIKHGFRPGHVLELTVEARQVGADLRFTIRDNGAGIPPERLAAINESFQLDLNSGFVHHIGLYNVQKMLSLLYGPSYGLHIDSAVGQGTCVVLTVPCEMEES